MRIYPLHTPLWLSSSRQESFESIPRHPNDKFRALLRCDSGMCSRLGFAFLRVGWRVLCVKLLKLNFVWQK
ncbi:hypothetical protein XBFM1_2020006 [Xenorhabdus bovienii str. feltiae Moldova]|uniref:Uncharacterized protein n=1 Tax=Xenorhabdus bovienii str. feltiae Moldova TaxID=1398200 RepID=A0A077NG83_XENBV|nr:hypothetical protein XBFM1_2020006 [Xenorhabdus bovienii str. feltiae Moldova]